MQRTSSKQPSIYSIATILLWLPASHVVAITDPNNNPDPVIDTTDPVISSGITNPPPIDAKLPIVKPNLTDIANPIIIQDNGTNFIFTPSGEIGPLAPGSHTITWTATDLGLNQDTGDQIITVLPSINLGLDQEVGEGGVATVTAHLSGKAANYPFTINFNIDNSNNNGGGTNDGSNDHSLVGPTTSLTFNEGELEKSLTIDIHPDPDVDVGETITLTLDNASIPANSIWTDLLITKSQTITITQPDQNHAPLARLHASQNGNTSRNITTDAGKVRICAMPNCSAGAYDANGDPLRYDWSASDNALIPITGTTGKTFEFETQGLTPGFYTIRLTVSDTAGKASSHDLLLNLLETEFELTEIDSDDDKSSDIEEGFYDNDNDGIPNFLDAIENDPSLMQAYAPYLFDSNLKIEDSYSIDSIELSWALSSSASNLTVYPLLIATSPGLHINIGPTAFAAGKTYARLETYIAENLRGASVPENVISSDGQVIDIEITNLNNAGDTALIVLPQAAPTPASQSGEPKFITFRNTRTWEEFVTDTNGDNQIHTAQKVNDYCPDLDATADYSPGLTVNPALYANPLATGDECLLIKIKDGGLNDYDGVANGTIRFMGAVFITSNSIADNDQAEGGIFTGDTDSALEGQNKLDLGTGSGGSLGFVSLFGLLFASFLRRFSKTGQ